MFRNFSRIRSLGIVLFILTATGAAMTHADEVKALTPTEMLAAPGAMAAATWGNHLFFVGYGHLWAADISDPGKPKVVGEVEFTGAGRQIAIENGIAYVTARTEGLFVIDVREATTPRVLSHYDTIELATGVDVHGALLFIAQRQYGVEIVDVSDPGNPKFVSRIRTGEAQSVMVRGRYLYVGDWGSQQVTTIDISNPRAPRVASQGNLDGFGDGVAAQGGYLYASTGHHARTEDARSRFQRKEGEAGFGEGHGLEVWSLADAGKPAFVSRVKFPKRYDLSYDMWSPAVSGNFVFCADTRNGVFAVDVSDAAHLKTVGRYEELTGGLAVGDGYVYAACPKKGLVVLEARGMAQRREAERGETVSIPAAAADAKYPRVYRPGGQIRSVDFVGEYAVVVAGMQGVHVLRLWPKVEVVSRIETRGLALCVDAQGDRIYVSEGPAGLSIWEHAGEGRFAERGRFVAERKRAIRHALVEGRSRYAIAESESIFHVIDVSDPSAPRQALEKKAVIIYGNQTSHGLVGGRYQCISDHRTPMRWLDMQAEKAEKVDTGIDLTDRLGFFDGATALGDRLLVTGGGGYRLAEALSTDLEQTPLYKCAKNFTGKPSVWGKGLFVVSRNRSRVAIADISNVEKPRLLHELETAGNPSGAVVRQGALLIPDGYNGLLIYDDFVKTLGLDVDKGAFLPAE